MGNQTSTPNNNQDNTDLKPKSMSQILDYIATYYILTMDFKSLRKLYDKEYCDKLVILTSDIIERYFTDMEITYLAQRIKNGVEVNEIDKDKIIFFNKDDLARFDIQNSIKKKRICLGIAKFYIKIAHLFAAIVTTINPIYVDKDCEGSTVRASIYEKGKIPKGVPRDIYKLNICDNRINSLKNGHSLEPDENGDINIGPKVCSSNVTDSGQDKTLEDEPGIPELIELYYDDNYDYKTGKFTGMSPKTKQIFDDNLKIFYNVFTGKSDMPPEITKFSDIKLRDYHRMPVCQGSNPAFERTYKGPITDKLIKDYADNLKQMIAKANNNQNALLAIINQIFTYTIDPQTKKKQIRIVPTLTEDRLQEIVVETRALIIKLYLTCEFDYNNNIKLFEAIVEKKIYETTQNQVKTLQQMKEKINTDDSVPEPAEVAEIKQNAEENIIKAEQEIDKAKQEISEKKQEVSEIISGNKDQQVNEQKIQEPEQKIQEPEQKP